MALFNDNQLLLSHVAVFLLKHQAHLVCYDKMYRSASEAFNKPGGLAVFGFWGEISADAANDQTLIGVLGSLQAELR